MGLKWKNGERCGKMGKLGGGKMGRDIDLGLLCYFLFPVEHHPSWLGMGNDIVLCPLLS